MHMLPKPDTRFEYVVGELVVVVAVGLAVVLLVASTWKFSAASVSVAVGVGVAVAVVVGVGLLPVAYVPGTVAVAATVQNEGAVSGMVMVTGEPVLVVVFSPVLAVPLVFMQVTSYVSVTVRPAGVVVAHSPSDVG
jgi:hypothetical protein